MVLGARSGAHLAPAGLGKQSRCRAWGLGAGPRRCCRARQRSPSPAGSGSALEPPRPLPGAQGAPAAETPSAADGDPGAGTAGAGQAVPGQTVPGQPQRRRRFPAFIRCPRGAAGARSGTPTAAPAEPRRGARPEPRAGAGSVGRERGTWAPGPRSGPAPERGSSCPRRRAGDGEAGLGKSRAWARLRCCRGPPAARGGTEPRDPQPARQGEADGDQDSPAGSAPPRDPALAPSTAPSPARPHRPRAPRSPRRSPRAGAPSPRPDRWGPPSAPVPASAPLGGGAVLAAEEEARGGAGGGARRGGGAEPRARARGGVWPRCTGGAPGRMRGAWPRWAGRGRVGVGVA